MLKKILPILLLLSVLPRLQAQTDEDVFKVREMFENVLTKGECYHWLHYLCKKVGHRIAGSPAGAAAVEYTKQMLDTIGCDKVWLQPVKVRYWTRGNIEECRLVSSFAGSIDLAVVALGYSAPTGTEGLSAEVVEVKSVDELEKMDPAKVKGKIIFFNGPMDATKISTFHAYGAVGNQRVNGPNKAAAMGAVAAVVRSLTLKQDDVPHSGVTIFSAGNQAIPAVGMGVLSADRLSSLLKKDPKLRLFLRLDCKEHGQQETYNVIGEIKGSVHPDKNILIGGHIDSWDLGEGAHDDGAGCVHAMEVLHTFKRMGIRPRHTIRCVLFANEENGLRGGTEYAEQAKKKGEKHIAAIESDGGGHTPRGFGLDATPDVLKKGYEKAKKWREIIAPYGFYEMEPGGSGADIGPLKSQNVLLFGFRPDSQRYFDYHHTRNDIFENVHKRELELGAAGIAALVYLIDKYGVE